MLTPTNVKDGIRAGAFQGMGYLGRGPGVFVGEVFPYSIAPANNGQDAILTGTIEPNATIYLPLGSIPFIPDPNHPEIKLPGVTLLDSSLFPGGKCVELDYERSLLLAVDQNCTITTSCMDRYWQKMVIQTVSTQGSNPTPDLGPAKYFQSIKVKNDSSSTLTFNLYVGAKFGVPYMMLYNIDDFVKMLIYDGNPLVTSDGIPAPLTWLPALANGVTPTKDAVATITTGFTRPTIDCFNLFIDGAPFEDRPFNGVKVLTFFTQHFGFGNLPSFASREEQLQWLNGNNTTIIGLKPYSDGFTPWFR